MKPTILLLTLALFGLARAAEPIADVKEEAEFFNLGHAHKHLVVGFYDSVGKPESKDFVLGMLEKLAGDAYFQKHQYKFASVDFKNMERIVKHYDVQGHAGVFYYIENQLQQFREFGDLAGEAMEKRLQSDLVYHKLHTFLAGKHERISKRLHNIQEFNDALDAFKIIGVYIGKEGSSGHQKYKRLAYSHVSFHFFEIADATFARALYKQLNRAEWNERDTFLIVRHKSVLTEFDRRESVELDCAKSYNYFKAFLILERHEKLRNDNHGGEIFMDVFHKRVKLVLHTYNSQTPHEQIQAFEDAVQRVPKAMFFANVHTDAQWVGHFLQMFNLAQKPMEANKVYLLYATGHDIEIHEVTTDITEDAIVDATWAAYRKFRDVFNGEERAIMEANDSLAEVQDDL